ncbi:PKD domain-containing protein [bacterium]|nr:PKD domain-containing protein [bacterium]
MKRLLLLLLRALPAIVLALSVCACGAGGADRVTAADPAGKPQPASPAAPQLSLPSPADLPRSAAAGQGDRLLNGSEYDAALPDSRVISSAPQLSFAPAGEGLGDAAYAIYHFDIPAFEGSGSIQTSWDSRPAAGKFFLAVADYSKNAWSWFSGDSAGPLALPGGIDFKSPSGQCYVVVLVTGTSINALQEIDFGGAGTPVAVLRPQFEFLSVGTSNVYSATESSDDAGIVKHEWDLDGDGSFELDSGTEPTASKTYSGAGTVTVRLKVTDAEGKTSTDSAVIEVSLVAGFDEIEPDNTPATACQLPAMSFTDFRCYSNSVNDGDSLDYYRFTVSEPARVTFYADFAIGEFVLLSLYDNAGNELKNPLTNVLTYRFDNPGDYILLASGDNTNDVPYSLQAEADYVTAYSEVEPNNSLDSANQLNIGDGLEASGNVGTGGYDGGIEDNFRLSVLGGHYYALNIDDFEDAGTLGVRIYGSNKELLEIWDGSSLNYDISLEAQSDGTFYFQVFNAVDAPAADYGLSVVDYGEMPIPVLDAEVTPGGAPYLVNFTATAQYVPAGTSISAYYWDFDGNKVWDLSTVDPQASTTYYRYRTYNPRVTIVLDNGSQGSDTTEVLQLYPYTEVEDNDSFAGAQVLISTNTIYGDLGGGADAFDGDSEDYFKFTAPFSGDFNAVLNYNPLFYTLGVTLGQYDELSEEFTLIDASRSNQGFDSVSGTISVGQTYYLIVDGDEDAYFGGGYTLGMN